MAHNSASSLTSDAQSAADLLTDVFYIAPAIDIATLHSMAPSSPTFLYVFNYTSTTTTATHAPAALALTSGYQPSPLPVEPHPWPPSPPTRTQRSTATHDKHWRLPPHADDLLMYVLGSAVSDGVEPYPSTFYSRHDLVVSEIVMKYWTNFIKTG